MTTVFVGNISYDVSEDEIVQLFSSAGRVNSFRFVIDKESGKSRGFGFCEFQTEEEAIQAIETLNNFTLRGRTLKVDSADGNQDGTGVGPKGGRQQKDIEKAIGELGLIQLYDILFKFKQMISEDYANARKLLVEYPVLAQGLLRGAKVFETLKHLELNETMEIDGTGIAGTSEEALSAEIIQKVLSLRPDEIENLPAEQKGKVLSIIQQQMQSLKAHSTGF